MSGRRILEDVRKIFVAVLAAAAGPVAAATFQVSNLADSGPGSLRQAVLDANALTGADEITFQPGLTGTIILTSGEIAIKDDLEVSGPGAGVLTVSADHRPTRIFGVYDGTARVLDVTVSGLLLTGASPRGTGGAIAVSGESLAILDTVISDSEAVGFMLNPGRGGCVVAVDSALRIERSVLTGGSAFFGYQGGGPGEGGNLYLTGGTLLVEQSTVSGGSSNYGGGAVIRNATAVFRDSTITGNEASGFVGIVGGLAITQSAVMLERTTVSGNSAHGRSGLSIALGSSVLVVDSTVSGNRAELGEAGGIFLSVDSTLTLRLSTLSDNSAVRGGGSIHLEENGVLDLDHTIVANGTPQDLFRENGTINAIYSLVEAPGDAINGTNVNNLFGVDPILGPLANNGGPTQTHSLLPRSPAINAGNPLIPDPPPTDQRGPGFVRIFNGRVDLGSFELQQAVGTIEVPALSPVGLAVLMALLAGVGLWVLRR